MDNWYVPITILPGICLLILSTSNLLIGLNQEIFKLTSGKVDKPLLRKKIRQLERLSKAMVGFYLTCALMVLSGILSAFDTKASTFDFAFFTMLSGIIITLASLLFLIQYALNAVTIRKKQHQKSLKEISD